MSSLLNSGNGLDFNLLLVLPIHNQQKLKFLFCGGGGGGGHLYKSKKRGES